MIYELHNNGNKYQLIYLLFSNLLEKNMAASVHFISCIRCKIGRKSAERNIEFSFRFAVLCVFELESHMI